MNKHLSIAAVLVIANTLPVSAVAARCTDITNRASIGLKGESLKTQSSTASPSHLEFEDVYYVGREAHVLIALNIDRRPGDPPIAAGMQIETASPPIPVEVQIFDIDDNQRTLLCTASRHLNGIGGIALKVESDSPTKSLAVRYSAERLPVRARLVANVYSYADSASALFPPTCREVDAGALQAGFSVNQTRHVKINPGDSCRRRIVLRSPNDLLVSVKGGAGSAITASFKPADSYAPFAPFCNADITSDHNAHYIVGLHPSLPILRDGTQLWAIDVDTACTNASTVEINIHDVASRVSGPELDKLAPIARAYGTPAYLTDMRLSCFSDLRSLGLMMLWDQNRRRRPAAGKGFIDLRVLRRSGDLQPIENISVEKSVMYALSAWSRACLNCEAHTLALARINGRLFMSSLLIEDLLDLSPERASFAAPFARDVVVDEWSTRVLSSLGQKVPAYLQATPRDLKNLCASGVLEKLIGAGAKCQADVPMIPDSPKSGLRILLTEGFTSCDSNPDTIACEQWGDQIEFNIKDYTYTVDSSGEVAFGRGLREVSLDAVMAHEIGHWLGLDHVEKTDALMSPTVDKARCIVDADVEALLDRDPLINPTGSHTFRYK